MVEIPFAKYHALGNDFLVVQRTKSPGARQWETARLLCDRHTGVGADGVVCLSPGRKADRKIDIYNADGGWAEMSGNGIRIAGVWVSMFDKRQSTVSFETPGGIVAVQLLTPPSEVTQVSAAIGSPTFDVASLPMRYKSKRCINGRIKIGKQAITVVCVSVGNPHAVVPVQNFDFDWQALGRSIEKAPLFPRDTNVEFVKRKSRRKLEVMEWERGVGPTGSSGTGAAAAVAAMVVTGQAERKCQVKFPAGVLEVEWNASDNAIHLSGQVTFVMRGTFHSL
jgi:diaminopimelate epimerase